MTRYRDRLSKKIDKGKLIQDCHCDMCLRMYYIGDHMKLIDIHNNNEIYQYHHCATCYKLMYHYPDACRSKYGHNMGCILIRSAGDPEAYYYKLKKGILQPR